MAQKGCATQTRGQCSRESQPHFRHILTHARFSHHLLGEMQMYAQAKLGYLNVYAATHLGRTPRHTHVHTHTHTQPHAPGHMPGRLSQESLLCIHWGVPGASGNVSMSVCALTTHPLCSRHGGDSVREVLSP
ncbi:hypothetical protein mRhiFer1_009635 [Rhinolophus ferrumequinum]|uniref:Uncharacterized protein n=1 Tax=Rhinolophus ferrumequinum TaxID=59479 RepID=A0A7J7R6E3_RHIFE|nr:hypothetical protein mRhiFer1_009635 [Rhinolophus ferrumequinum]